MVREQVHSGQSIYWIKRPYCIYHGPSPGLGIGNVQSANFAEYFKGFIEEVRISDTALLPTEFLKAARVLVLRSHLVVGNNLELSFSVVSGDVHSFALFQAAQLVDSWITNTGAILSTDGPSSYSFLVPAPTNPAQFYRVQLQ